MRTTIGILAHVDAGKTTLAEQVLFQSGAIRSAGRVDRQNAFLDSGRMERQRGITIFSGQAPFSWAGRDFDLLDTPGHGDFSGEMERALWVMDCAVLVVSAAEGIQSHTETVWRLLRRAGVPVLVFLNKIDRVGADPDAVRQELARRWKVSCPVWERDFPEPLREELAALDEELMEGYFSGGLSQEDWLTAARALFARGEFCPVLQGAALEGKGVGELLDALAALAPSPAGDSKAPFCGRVYKVLHDKQGGRLVCLKVLSGTLRPRDLIETPAPAGGESLFEKAGELRRLNGAKSAPISEALPGDLCAVAGLVSPRPGDQVGRGAERLDPFSLRPLLSARVLPPPGTAPQTLLAWLRELEDEEPLLSVRWDGALGEISVRVMGKMQLEVLKGWISERFGVQVDFGKCQVLYQETLKAPSYGCGHYEPLRHYAEVHLLLSPGKRGSGLVFDSACPTDDLAANWQHLIRTHVLEKEHLGVLTGMPATDLRITLLAGRAHLKHTEGGDFREATYRAIRQGLMMGETLLLEPWYRFEIQVPVGLAGRVLTDVQRMQGESDPPVLEGEIASITGRAPASEMMDYPADLTSLTRGMGRISLAFCGYEPCHNPDQVAAERGYNPERDGENPPDSVFCSHGAGFTVNWREAPSHMHIKLKNPLALSPDE